MKLQMAIAGVVLTAFVAALASSSQSSRGRTIAFLLIGTAAAGYVENLTLSTMALVWEPDEISLVTGVLGALRTAAGALATSMYSIHPRYRGHERAYRSTSHLLPFKQVCRKADCLR